MPVEQKGSGSSEPQKPLGEAGKLRTREQVIADVRARRAQQRTPAEQPAPIPVPAETVEGQLTQPTALPEPDRELEPPPTAISAGVEQTKDPLEGKTPQEVMDILDKEIKARSLTPESCDAVDKALRQKLAGLSTEEHDAIVSDTDAVAADLKRRKVYELIPEDKRETYIPLLNQWYIDAVEASLAKYRNESVLPAVTLITEVRQKAQQEPSAVPPQMNGEQNLIVNQPSELRTREQMIADAKARRAQQRTPAEQPAPIPVPAETVEGQSTSPAVLPEPDKKSELPVAPVQVEQTPEEKVKAAEEACKIADKTHSERFRPYRELLSRDEAFISAEKARIESSKIYGNAFRESELKREDFDVTPSGKKLRNDWNELYVAAENVEKAFRATPGGKKLWEEWERDYNAYRKALLVLGQARTELESARRASLAPPAEPVKREAQQPEPSTAEARAPPPQKHGEITPILKGDLLKGVREALKASGDRKVVRLGVTPEQLAGLIKKVEWLDVQDWISKNLKLNSGTKVKIENGNKLSVSGRSAILSDLDKGLSCSFLFTAKDGRLDLNPNFSIKYAQAFSLKFINALEGELKDNSGKLDEAIKETINAYLRKQGIKDRYIVGINIKDDQIVFDFTEDFLAAGLYLSAEAFGSPAPAAKTETEFESEAEDTAWLASLAGKGISGRREIKEFRDNLEKSGYKYKEQIYGSGFPWFARRDRKPLLMLLDEKGEYVVTDALGNGLGQTSLKDVNQFLRSELKKTAKVRAERREARRARIEAGKKELASNIAVRKWSFGNSTNGSGRGIIVIRDEKGQNVYQDEDGTEYGFFFYADAIKFVKEIIAKAEKK